LFPVRLPSGYRLVLGVNGSPLMQMSVFGPDGDLLEAKGPLRVVSLGVQKRSPVQLLVTNDGVAPALITLSLRADPPAAVTVPEPSPPGAADQLETPQVPTVPAPAAPAPPAPPAVAPPPPVASPVN
jgi:serine/threonine-protein kinase